MTRKTLAIPLLLLATSGPGQTTYRLPPPDVVAIVDAPPPPTAIVSPAGNGILFYTATAQPSLAVVSRPFLPLAGIRIDPELRSRQRLTESTGIALQILPAGKPIPLALPNDGRLGIPRWSHDGKRFVLLHAREGGAELWVGEGATGKVRRLTGFRVTEVVASGALWMSDNRTILAALVPAAAGPPPVPPRVPEGPNVEETAGKRSQVATFQDLLKTEADGRLFAYYATSQLALVDAVTGRVTNLGAPGMFTRATESPDGKFILVQRMKQPFSMRVPYDGFAAIVEVWDRAGKVVATVADEPVADEVPRQGVPTGPRAIDWQVLQPATLVWAEALDGGDPMAKAPFRDRLMRWSAPFQGSPREVMKIPQRFTDLSWLARPDRGLLSQYDRERRWRTTLVVDLASPGSGADTLFDLSANDSYNDPGQLLTETRPDGEEVALQEGEWVYFLSRGMSAQGARPALVRWNLATRTSETVFRSGEGVFEQFVRFLDRERKQFLLRHESPTEPPNYFIGALGSTERTRITDVRDPAPQLTGIKRTVLKYARDDGVPLSGTLYLPPGYEAGKRIPALIWAYPLEYSDAATAGQVRATPTRFTYFRGASPLFFLLRGYAVLMDATMPVVGDPETMNDTFVEQIVGAAKGAIDALDSLGVVDRKRVLVAGHSYGAFMTANLLAYSDLFAAGIARSGAYNRTLTPFGFQSERRTFWEAPEVYLKVSPFAHADKIKKPLLLIHGEADNNSGTFPIQSERLYQAIRGHGGTVRLVLLPKESHGYSARESVLHTLAEMFDWADRFVTNAR
jgi:dipeptidyl aminopeptidase/acylaminoacyl peptidase